jgi:23S rRNA pseudouridine1911/1915/1917 synthase
MVFAKSEGIKKKLMENWDSAVTARRYLALAEGDFPRNRHGGTGFETDEGIINEPLGEDGGGRVIVKAGGKRALTRWKLLGRGKGYSLLSLDLETGRRNQIRAHLFFLGCPVAGDKKYGAKTDPLGRLALHAETLCFYHPAGGQPMEFVSPAFSALVNRRLGLSRSSR